MTVFLIRNNETMRCAEVAFASERAACLYIKGWGPKWSAVWASIYTLEDVEDIVINRDADK